MKLSVPLVALFVVGTNAFCPSAFHRPSTCLNLFGGGNKDGGGAKKQPNMMDQLAMFKKAQEIAQKKKDIENELAKMDYSGSAADGKVTATIKFVPSTSPMDPNPEYAVKSFKFDEAFYEAATTEELSQAITDSYRSGIVAAKVDSEDKFKVLGMELQAMMQGMGGQK